MPITLADAKVLLQAGEAKAADMRLVVSISVVDARGDVVAIHRMDGARYFTPEVARGKAMAAAVFGQPSAELTERAKLPALQSLNQMHQGRFVFGQGGLPISRTAETEGAVGVSGGTAEQDEEIAKAAIAAL